MNIWRLFVQEILFRRWNFILAVLSVTVAAGCLVAQLTILRLHDATTQIFLEDKVRETGERLAREETKTKTRLQKLEDDYRKITKKLGFNIIIVSDQESLPEMDKRHYAVEEMPEEYAFKLANSKIVTINHLLPMVQEEVEWPGLEGKVLLNGVRGEVALLHADEKKPLIQPVPKGTLVLGHYVHTVLDLKKGDLVEFRGQPFTVHNLLPYRGKGKEDWTVWMNLDEAQELLDRKGKINVIWALECNCAAEDRLAEVRAEVKGILPNTEVQEVYTEALVRAEARERAKKEAQDALAQEQERAREELVGAAATRNELRRQLTGFAALLIPLVLLGSIVWLGVMTLNNVRERQTEIGILRALGLASGSIYTLFISRAVAVGLVGALLGYGLGLSAGLIWGEHEVALAGGAPLVEPILLAVVLLGIPALCAVVGWMAALAAAKQDPAVVLQQA